MVHFPLVHAAYSLRFAPAMMRTNRYQHGLASAVRGSALRGVEEAAALWRATRAGLATAPTQRATAAAKRVRVAAAAGAAARAAAVAQDLVSVRVAAVGEARDAQVTRMGLCEREESVVVRVRVVAGANGQLVGSVG